MIYTGCYFVEAMVVALACAWTYWS